ncbi:MAG: antA/AntB antirepressor family protein, partial [Proteobacteria bacterium]|nr:antA/AntB antirepressor family protein [Pseudomonadota bacterium]
SIWLKRQLVNSPYFQEGLDYFLTECSRGSAGGSPKQIYEITLPTAMKLAMLSSTNRGSQLPPTKDGGFRARK